MSLCETCHNADPYKQGCIHYRKPLKCEGYWPIKPEQLDHDTHVSWCEACGYCTTYKGGKCGYCGVEKPKQKERGTGMEKYLTLKELLQAVVDGKSLEFRRRFNGEWKPFEVSIYCGSLTITMSGYDYRLKPNVTWKPWTFETAPRCGETINQNANELEITGRGPVGLWVNSNFISYDTLLVSIKFTYNGEQCGTKVEE